jgi:hypothetical protein
MKKAILYPLLIATAVILGLYLLSEAQLNMPFLYGLF